MITVNGVDLALLGFTAHTRSLPRLGGARASIAELPGAIGGALLGASTGPGNISVTGMVTAADRVSLNQRIDEIAVLLQAQAVIRFSDLADREWHGLLEQASVSLDDIPPHWSSRAARLTLGWVLPDPRAVAQSETVLAGPEALTLLGTAPSRFAVDVQATTGTITRIVVTVQAGAAVLRSLTWDGSFSPPVLWSLDDETYTVTVGGANAIAGLSPDSVFPFAHPLEGADRVVVAVTGGTADITVRYRKRWW